MSGFKPSALYQDSNGRYVYVEYNATTYKSRFFVGRPGSMEALSVTQDNSRGLSKRYQLSNGARFESKYNEYVRYNGVNLTRLDVSDTKLVESLGVGKKTVTAAPAAQADSEYTPAGLYKDTNGRFIYVDSKNYKYRFFIGRPGEMEQVKITNVDTRRDGGTMYMTLENGKRFYRPSPFKDGITNVASYGDITLIKLDITDQQLIASLGIGQKKTPPSNPSPKP